VADLNIAQDTPNPAQQPQPAPDANKPQGEAPANATAALAFDEGKHPRADDGKFGEGGGGAKKEDAPAKPSGNGGEGDGIDSKIASVRDGKGSMEFFHGTRMKNADLHIGKTFTDNQETAHNYASEKTFQGNVDVSGLKIAKVKRFDREDANYGAVGDTDDDIADLQERGIDLIEYDDEDPSNKEHSAYRIVSDKALDRFRDGVTLKDNRVSKLAQAASEYNGFPDDIEEIKKGLGDLDSAFEYLAKTTDEATANDIFKEAKLKVPAKPATAALAFDEGKHPRADDGKFGSGGGGAKKEDAPAKKEAAKTGETAKPKNPAEAFKAKHGRDPTFEELHSGKGGLIEKLDKFDKANPKPSHSIRDVTPEGFGPTDSGHDANKPDPERLPAPDATTVQNLKNSIADAQTILKGKLTPEKQAQIHASLEATKKKLEDLQNHEPTTAPKSETGEGADGKQKPVSQMSKGEKKTHDMRKKLEALRAKNAEGAKKLADTNARVSELHSQLVEQLKAGTGTANDDLKKTVNELGAKIAETKMHTQTIQHALRGEDIAADEHGQDSPEHEAARKRTEYVAKLADFDEGKHPRADDGKFGSGGGGAKKEDEPKGKWTGTHEEKMRDHLNKSRIASDRVTMHAESASANAYSAREQISDEDRRRRHWKAQELHKEAAAKQSENGNDDAAKYHHDAAEEHWNEAQKI
jgi:hypothetical protein